MIVTPGELNRRAELYHQLAASIAAGVPLMKALEMAGRSPTARGSRKIIPILIGHLQEGHTFTDSMIKIKGWLPEFDVALLSAGEKSGQIDESFKLLARYYASRAKIIRDTISDLVVTILTLHVFFLVFPVTLFVAFFWGFMDNQYSQCIPFIIQKTIIFGGIYGIVLLSVFACGGNRGESWRLLIEKIFQMVPLLRTALKYLALARLASALDALNKAGVSAVAGWRLAGAASGSPHLKREILKWSPQLETGLTPAEMVTQIRYFPEMFSNLYQTAELSGKVDETLVRLNTYFEEEGFRTLRLFTQILNKTLYFLLVFMVAYSVIGFYTGYFNAALNAF
jgi:type IV pilus assembly protein PilC